MPFTGINLCEPKINTQKHQNNKFMFVIWIQYLPDINNVPYRCVSS